MSIQRLEQSLETEKLEKKDLSQKLSALEAELKQLELKESQANQQLSNNQSKQDEDKQRFLETIQAQEAEIHNIKKQFQAASRDYEDLLNTTKQRYKEKSSTMKQTIEHLTKDLEETQRRLQDSEENSLTIQNQLREQLGSQEQENESLLQRLENLSKAVEEKSSQFETTLKEQLQKQSNDLHKTFEKNQEDLESELSAKLAKSEGELKRIAEVYAKMQQTCKTAHMLKSTHQEIVADKDAIISRLREELKLNDERILELTFNKMSKKYKDDGSGSTERVRINSAEHFIEENSLIGPLEERLRYLQGQLDIKTQKCEKLAEKNSQLGAKETSFFEKEKRFEAKIKDLKKEVDSLSQKLKNEKEEKLKIRDVLNTTRSGKLDLEVELETLRLQFDDFRSKFEKTSKSKEELEMKVKRAEEESFKLVEALKGFKIQNESLTLENQHLEAKLTETEDNLETWIHKVKSADQMNSDSTHKLKSSYETLVAKFAQLEEDFTKSKRQGQILEDRVNKHQGEKDALTTELQTKNEETKGLLEKVEELRKVKISLSSKLRFLKKKMSSLISEGALRSIKLQHGGLKDEVKVLKMNFYKFLKFLMSHLKTKIYEYTEGEALKRKEVINQVRETYKEHITNLERSGEEAAEKLKAKALEVHLLKQELVKFQTKAEKSINDLMAVLQEFRKQAANDLEIERRQSDEKLEAQKRDFEGKIRQVRSRIKASVMKTREVEKEKLKALLSNYEREIRQRVFAQSLAGDKFLDRMFME